MSESNLAVSFAVEMPQGTLLESIPARMFRLTILGDPVAKGRPKLGTVNGHAMAFTPAKTRRYEDIVRQTAIREWNRPLLTDTPLSISVSCFRQIPKSASRKVKEAMLLGTIRPLGRPDLDNNVKAVTDALNGVVYYDDSAIVETHSFKWYGLDPRVEVTLTW